jgi:L-arabinokinase
MPTPLCFYVSGHGYGHARRTTQVIREFHRRRPDVTIRIRSAAPARIFQPLPPQWVEHSEIDAGPVEIDAVTIDRENSLQNLLAFMARRSHILAAEVAAIRRLGPGLIVADIPFLAGDVAAEVGVPCIGVSNFTWDWIYETLFAGDPRYEAVAGSLVASYAKMSALLQLPFGRTCPAIARKIASPLVAMRSRREKGEVMAQLGISPTDHRPRVLIGTRGGLPPDAIAQLSRDAGEFLLLCPHEPRETLPANGVSVPLGPGLDFSDVLLVSDVVVSKLGYGVVSECIATQTRLVWPPRVGFAEDAIMQNEAARLVPMMQIGLEDYRSGRWGGYLRAAMQRPPAAEAIRIDGAEFCAEFLSATIKE